MGHDLVGGWFTFEIDFGNDGFFFFMQPRRVASRTQLGRPQPTRIASMGIVTLLSLKSATLGFKLTFQSPVCPRPGRLRAWRSGSLGVQDLWEFLGPVVRDNELAGSLAEHVRDSLEQLFKEFGKVVPPDRPTVSALGFHVIVRYVKTIQFSIKLSIALQQKIIDSAGNPEELSIVACIGGGGVCQFGVALFQLSFWCSSAERAHPLKDVWVCHSRVNGVATAHRQANDRAFTGLLSDVVLLCQQWQ